jgi:predicted nucleic acid-binding protein
MTDEYIYDTEAIIAFLYDEPGHEIVAALLNDVFDGSTEGSLAEMNASEVFYLVARFEGTADGESTPTSLRVADRDIRALQQQGLHIRLPNWQLVGEIKAHGHLSLADACAVALAHDRDATLVVGADDDFDDLPIDVPLEQFRDHSV